MQQRGVVAVALAVSVWTAHGAAAEPNLEGYDNIAPGALDAHAVAEGYLTHAFDAPNSIATPFAGFGHTDRAAIGWLRARIAHRPQTFGFLVDLAYGDLADLFAGADPAHYDHHAEARDLSHIAQAYVTAVAAVGRGLTIDVGKFDTPIGYEEKESTPNQVYSRSLLYTWCEPAIHTGVRMSLPLTDTFTALALWVNGWNANVQDGSGMRSAVVGGRWKPSERWMFEAYYSGGLERALAGAKLSALNFRNLLSGYGAYSPKPWLTFASIIDYATDNGGGGVRFGGVSGYALVHTPHVGFALRAEWLDDPQGFATGTTQTWTEETAVAEVRGAQRIAGRPLTAALRMEYRHDHSSAFTFAHSSGQQDAVDAITIALLLGY